MGGRAEKIVRRRPDRLNLYTVNAPQRVAKVLVNLLANVGAD
jgi:hypothetical protein